MGFPKMIDQETIRKVTSHEDRIQALEDHKKLCDELHDISKDHRKRSDDAMNNLTQSNLLLAKSIDNMNLTLSEIVRDDRPIVKRSKIFWLWVDNFLIWLGVSRRIGKWIFGSVVALAAFAAALKTLGVW